MLSKCNNEGMHVLIVSLVEKLPLLHHIHIIMCEDEIDRSFVLVVISKCSSLQKSTSASEERCCDFETFTSIQFFDKISKTAYRSEM